MGSLLSYSGISTKIRSMKSDLINTDQFKEIVQLKNVQQVAAYLKQTKEYGKSWEAIDVNDLHRGEIEKLLIKKSFENFFKLYSFSSPVQRGFLDLYAKRYVIRVLKEIMANLFDHRDTKPLDVTEYYEFFRRHSKLDLDKLVNSNNLDEFIGNLRGSEFYDPLYKMQSRGGGLLFDYGMALDLYYFAQLWRIKSKVFHGKELEEMTKIYGQKFDMLNLQFIQRSKKCFNMEPVQIYAMLIPVNYRLKKEEVKALVEASTNDEFKQIFLKTYYGKKYTKLDSSNIEEFYNKILRQVLEREARNNPYSVAVLYSYLYLKEHECKRLTMAIECVRYGIDPEIAMGYIENN